MATTLRPDPGLVASPRLWHKTEVEGSGVGARRYRLVMVSRSDAIAVLEAQRACFSSDEDIAERAATWRAATPEE
jgi:hypothetical protein